MTYERRRGNSNYNYELSASRLCNRCGEKVSSHSNSTNVGRNCDNLRYLRNYHKECGCRRTPIYEMSQIQRREGDPEWNVSTHCCFCKRTTMLVNLKEIKIEGRKYEQCKACKRETYIPEREVYYEDRRSQREKRERSSSWELSSTKKVKPTPVNVYANDIVFNPVKESKSCNESSTFTPACIKEEEIDWAKDTEEQINR